MKRLRLDLFPLGIVFGFFILWSAPSAFARAKGKSVPGEMRELLARHPEWRSMPVDPESHGPGGLAITKNWIVRDEGTRFELEERTKLSLCESSEGLSWCKGTIDLSDSAESLWLFKIDNETDRFTDLMLEPLPDDRFVLSFLREANGKAIPAAIYFIPRVEIDLPPIPEHLNFPTYSAPWNALPALRKGIFRIPYFPKPFPKEKAPLRHELSRRKEVWIDPSVPELFHSAVVQVCQEYNNILGTELFRVRYSAKRLSQEDCLTSDDRLCVFWSGPRDRFSWLLGGESNPSYDALSGAILGGTIVIENNLIDTAENPFGQTPDAILARYLNDSFSLTDLARISWETPRFGTFAHPEPRMQFVGTFTHELGHYLGLPHDYYASIEGTPRSPSASIMEYSSFALFHKLTKPQPKDIAKLNSLYFNAPYDGPSSCTDEDIFDDPTCLAWDIGDPANWVIEQSEIAPAALFAELPMRAFYEKILGIRPRPIDRMGALLTLRSPNVTREQRARLRDYLCSRKDVLPQITKTLEEEYHFDLECP
jgi:hypothetical protein